MDLDPDSVPALFVSDIQNNLLPTVHFEGTFTLFFKDKKNYKEVIKQLNQGFLTIFA